MKCDQNPITVEDLGDGLTRVASRLRPVDLMILILYMEEGMTFQEIATLLCISLETARQYFKSVCEVIKQEVIKIKEDEDRQLPDL